MTWKGVSPTVHLVEGTYEKGIVVTTQKLEQIQVKSQVFLATGGKFAQMGYHWLPRPSWYIIFTRVPKRKASSIALKMALSCNPILNFLKYYL